jgi:hypothetical protein
MLDDILKKVEAAYDCCLAYTEENGTEKPRFERQVKFLINFSKTNHSLHAIVIKLSSVSQKEIRHKVLMSHTSMEQLQNSLVMPSRRAFYQNLTQRV